MSDRFSSAMKEIKGKTAGVGTLAKNKLMDVKTVVKANMAILSNQEKIKKAETELGHMYFNDFSSGNEPDNNAYEAVCAIITEANTVIAENRKILEAARAGMAGEIEDPNDVTDEDFEFFQK